jgi:hypothetical protein
VTRRADELDADDLIRSVARELMSLGELELLEVHAT